MPKSFTLADMQAIAEFGHRGQNDKAGNPYIEHPRRVLASAQARGAPPYAQFAALGHDLTEDTPFTIEMLRAWDVPEAALEIIRLMDRNLSGAEFKDKFGTMTDLNLVFTEYDARVNAYYYTELKKNEEARRVKLDDIGDNRQPWRLVYLPEADQTRLVKKYDDAIEALS